VLANHVFGILRLFMHLLCTILGHDIANNRFAPCCFHTHYLGSNWLDFRVKHVRTYVSYIVFPIFLILFSLYFSCSYVDAHFYK